MSITTDASWDTAAAADAVGALVLVSLAFTGGTIRVTNWPLDVTVLGYTWTGVGSLAEIGEIRESEDGNFQKLTLSLAQVKSSQLALALGAVETYQGRDALVYVALVDPATYQITGTPKLRFAGVMDKVSITRDESGVGKVNLELQTGGYNVRGNPAALRMNQAQHSTRHPGETGFRYIQDLIGKPQQWLSKKFQQI